MKRYFTALSILIFLSVSFCLAFIGKVARMNATSASRWNVVSYASTYGKGQAFHYLEYLPAGYIDNKDDYPVIISLTGLGWNEDTTSIGFKPNLLKDANLERTIRDGRNYPFIILTPHQPSKVKGRYDYTGRYDDGHYILDDSLKWDVNIIDEILEKAKKELRIDENRIYLIGCSMGGGGVWKYLKAHGDKIAAAVPISGYYTKYGPYNNNPHMDVEAATKLPVPFACDNKVKNTPVWAFHAADDDFILPVFTYKAVKVMNACKPAPDPKIKLTVFKDGGHLKIYPRVFEYSAKLSYEITQDPKVTGGEKSWAYLPTQPFKNDIFAWLLSHKLTEQSINMPPTDIALSNNKVSENEDVGTLVGKFSTVDPDEGDTHTYTLVNGEGDEGNNFFKIEGNQLLTATVLDYETNTSFKIRIQTNDGKGGIFATTFVVSVTNVEEDSNHAPTDIALSNNIIKENEPENTLIGNFTTTDEDEGDIHTYALVDGEGGEDNALFSIKKDQLLNQVIFDYELKTDYSIRVQTSDGKRGTFTKVFTISVEDTDENNSPTDIILSATSVEENAPEGTVVGVLSTVDADENDSHTYSLVSGEERSDNGFFTIEGNELKTAVVFDFEKKTSYQIRVKTKDENEGSYEKDFVIAIVDLDENTAPVVDNSIEDQSAQIGEKYSFTIPDDIFSDADEGDELSYSASLGDGNSLPSWLTFDTDSKVLSGTPTTTDTGTVTIQMKATDKRGETASTEFKLTVERITAVEDNIDQLLRIYPIPARDGVVVLDFGFTTEEPVQVTILTITGQVLMSKHLTHVKKEAVELKDISPGTYIIEIKSKNLNYRDKLLVE